MKRTKPLRRTPLRRVSAKRAKANRVYSLLRAEFLGIHTHCDACPKLRAGQRVAKSRDVHHIAGRTGNNLLDVSTWLAVCRPCHDWIHNHLGQARSLGLLK